MNSLTGLEGIDQLLSFHHSAMSSYDSIDLPTRLPHKFVKGFGLGTDLRRPTFTFENFKKITLEDKSFPRKVDDQSAIGMRIG